MKKIYFFLFAILLALLSQNTYSQIPTYNLRAMNFKYFGCPAKIIEFDIYMEHTNPPVYFEYSGAQFFFNFNPAIANGGTITATMVDSDIPPLQQNTNIIISGGNRIGIAPPVLPLPGNGYIMTNNGYPGTKMTRVRLITSAPSFANVPLNLVWRSQAPPPFTKVVANVNGVLTEIQTPTSNSINSGFSTECDLFNLVAPLNYNQVVSSPANFVWYKSMDAIRYKLVVATDFTFNNIVYNDSNFVDSFRVVSLNPNQNYFWKVMAGDLNGYFKTSEIWQFNTTQINTGTTPTYMLVVKNIVLNSPFDNELTFDIFMKHTNPPTIFEYTVGAYHFNFNSQIANGGTLTYELIGSDLPPNLQPVNPSISGDQLRLAANLPPPLGLGYNMTNNNLPGTKIAAMKLSTTAPSFAIDSLELGWRNAVHGAPFTKIFAYVNSVEAEITTPNTHSVDFVPVLPVELISFISSVNRNSVILNWSTSSEIDNEGFEIQRSLGDDQWSAAGYVEGSGNSSIRNNYSFTDKNLASGNYKYRLKQVDFNGNFEYFNLSNDVVVGIPGSYNLSQNYPNPFNPSTKIDFELPVDGEVSILLYDVSGREVRSIIKETKQAGYYSINFNASDLASGMYFYRMISRANGKDFVAVRKMIVIR